MSETRVAYLASESTIRKRVFARFALGPADIDRLAREVAILRTASYEGRLQQLADAAGHKGEVQLADPAVLRRIARESRDVAAGMVRSHNQDLRAWLAKQERGQSQRALGAAAREYAQQRAETHGKAAAFNEGMTGRNQAVRDVLERNGARVRVRAEPRSAAEAKCAAIVAGGWYEHRDAPSLPAHPRCLPAGTPVMPLGTVSAASRMAYAGPMVRFRTQGGAELMLTPNHDVLTGRGWLPARLLHEGDYVIRRITESETARAEGDDGPTAIDEIFGALFERHQSARRVASALDFHGDGAFGEGEVEIVWADRVLSGKRSASHLQQSSEVPFDGADTNAIPLSSQGASVKSFDRLGLPTHGSMGRVGRLWPGRDTATAENVGDTRWADRVTLADCAARLAGKVITDNVVSVESLPQGYVGHVYDLQTASGAYFAADIIIHNCVHSWALDTRIAAVLGSRKRVWLGDWIEGEK